eukprot:scaffold18400_cov31-Tisochrysis_lutea.AAC.1
MIAGRGANVAAAVAAPGKRGGARDAAPAGCAWVALATANSTARCTAEAIMPGIPSSRPSSNAVALSSTQAPRPVSVPTSEGFAPASRVGA